MSEIETSDKQNENNHSEDLINKENKEDTKIKDNSKLKYLLFALFSILIIIILLVCTYIYYQKSHSSKISETISLSKEHEDKFNSEILSIFFVKEKSHCEILFLFIS